MRSNKGVCALVLPLALGACGGMPTGEPLQGAAPQNLITHSMVNPLACLTMGFGCAAFASATEIADGWAATPHHAFMPWSADDYPKDAPGMDLVLYQTTEAKPVEAGTPHDGDAVMLYGASLGLDRQASGVVVEALTHAWLGGEWRLGMFISTDAAEGFSGGPVINAEGQWIGIVTDKMWLTWGPHKGMKGLFAYWAGDILKAAHDTGAPVARNLYQ